MKKKKKKKKIMLLMFYTNIFSNILLGNLNKMYC